MRFTGTRMLALAAALCAPCVGWAAEDAPLPPLLAPEGPQPVADAPSLSPPEDIEGAWVSDPVPAAMPAPAQQQPMPNPYMAGQPMPGQMMQGPQMGQQTMYDPYAQRAAAMYGGYPEDYAGSRETQFLSGEGEYGEYSQYGGASPSGDCGSGAEGGYGGECADGSCGYGGCGGCCGSLWDQVHSHQRFYFREEVLSFWGKGNPLPALATTSPVGTPQDDAGVLGLDTTSVLIGNERANEDARLGGRVTLGMWLVDGEFLGIEGHYMGFQQSVDTFRESGEFNNGGDGPILARPFYNAETDQQDSSLLAFPDFDNNGTITQLDGRIDVQSKVATHSAGLLLRKLFFIEFTKQWRLEGVAGYRFFRVDDGVRIADNWSEFGGQLGDASFASYDYFQAQNQFHGGELGLIGAFYHGCWSLEATGKVALGNSHQHVKIDGTSFVSVGGNTVETGNFRLLTQPTNDGIYKQDEFAVLPEFNVNLRFDATQNIRLLLGYNFMYLSQVQRSGDAIDLQVNPTQIGGQLVGPARPRFRFDSEDFYLHGISGGLELRY